ncbi:MAG TPA: hypothetical protein VNZ45_14180 [Bacteroidia bacterium]|jgi:hypothetical protein|nr:hypothetical protein [Bacteroidia bacterium]
MTTKVFVESGLNPAETMNKLKKAIEEDENSELKKLAGITSVLISSSHTITIEAGFWEGTALLIYK